MMIARGIWGGQSSAICLYPVLYPECSARLTTSCMHTCHDYSYFGSCTMGAL